MASKSARKRRKRRPPPPEQAAAGAAADEPQAAAPQRAASASGRPRRRGEPEAPPEPPWGKFPLIELSVLLGIIFLIIGFFFADGSRGPIFIGTGLLLGSIGGLELSIREHFTGYRSHTAILAGLPALIVLGVLFYAGPDGLPGYARAGIALVVFAIAAFLFTRVFQKASGGRAFKFRPDRQ